MSKHTPGPWEVGQYEDSTELGVFHRDGKEISYADSILSNTLKICRGLDGPTRKANAYLIAAAPELLEACKEASAGDLGKHCDSEIDIRARGLDFLSYEVGFSAALSIIEKILRPIITKAEGRSNE